LAPSTRHNTLRWILAVGAAAVSVLILGFTLFDWATTSLAEGIVLKPFNEALKEGITIKLGISSNLFQLAVIVTGALWALVIAKEDEAGIVLANRPEVVMFVCASALLLTSLLAYAVYTARVSYLYEIAGQPGPPGAPLRVGDFNNPVVNNFFSYQITNLAAGLTAAIVTLISAHKLK
jgi:hypothetical protein